MSILGISHDKHENAAVVLSKDTITHTCYSPWTMNSHSSEAAQKKKYNRWTKNPLNMEVGNVNIKHLVLALKGELLNGWERAVKRLSRSSNQGLSQFN